MSCSHDSTTKDFSQEAKDNGSASGGTNLGDKVSTAFKDESPTRTLRQHLDEICAQQSASVGIKSGVKRHNDSFESTIKNFDSRMFFPYLAKAPKDDLITSPVLPKRSATKNAIIGEQLWNINRARKTIGEISDRLEELREPKMALQESNTFMQKALLLQQSLNKESEREVSQIRAINDDLTYTMCLLKSVRETYEAKKALFARSLSELQTTIATVNELAGEAKVPSEKLLNEDVWAHLQNDENSAFLEKLRPVLKPFEAASSQLQTIAMKEEYQYYHVIPMAFQECGNCHNNIHLNAPVCTHCAAKMIANNAKNGANSAQMLHFLKPSTSSTDEHFQPSKTVCDFCEKKLQRGNIFSCTHCAAGLNWCCGRCVIKNHKGHLSNVEEIGMTDVWTKAAMRMAQGSNFAQM
uniref:C4H2-type domain-containing protein n=1 Tax=Steinernema glaseri TaxID=37863 RepID=A0A1I7YBT3_9BILA